MLLGKVGDRRKRQKRVWHWREQFLVTKWTQRSPASHNLGSARSHHENKSLWCNMYTLLQKLHTCLKYPPSKPNILSNLKTFVATYENHQFDKISVVVDIRHTLHSPLYERHATLLESMHPCCRQRQRQAYASLGREWRWKGSQTFTLYLHPQFFWQQIFSENHNPLIVTKLSCGA